MLAAIFKRSAALVAILAVAGGCGGEAAPEAGEEAPGAGEEGAAPAVDPATAATVRGQVAFEGTPPAPRPIDMAEEPECAQAYGDEGPRSQEVLVRDGRLSNVFVYVKEGLEGQFPAPSDPVTLDQENCRYDPHVLGLQVGQPLRVTNSDDLLHNINARPQRNRGFNFSQPRAGMESTRTFALQEVMIPVACDVHGWMQAYVGVMEHPYYDVTGEDGSFELSNLPPGEYVVEAWHERYGTQTRTVTVGARETAEVAFRFSESAAEGAVVPLGEPLIVRWHGEGGPELVRAGEARAAGATAGR